MSREKRREGRWDPNRYVLQGNTIYDTQCNTLVAVGRPRKMRRRLRALNRGEVDFSGRTIPIADRHPGALEARARRLGHGSHRDWLREMQGAEGGEA